MSDGMYDSRMRASAQSVRPGDIYRHFKGGLYIILALAKDNMYPYSKDLRKVVYLSLEDGTPYHRDMHEFIDIVNREETGFKDVSRFTFVSPQSTILIDERGNYNVNRKY